MGRTASGMDAGHLGLRVTGAGPSRLNAVSGILGVTCHICMKEPGGGGDHSATRPNYTGRLDSVICAFPDPIFTIIDIEYRSAPRLADKSLIASRGQPQAAGASRLCCTRSLESEVPGSSQHDARVLQRLARSSTPSCQPCALQHPARCTLRGMANHAKHDGKQLCRFAHQVVPPSAAACTRGSSIQHSCWIARQSGPLAASGHAAVTPARRQRGDQRPGQERGGCCQTQRAAG